MTELPAATGNPADSRPDPRPEETLEVTPEKTPERTPGGVPLAPSRGPLPRQAALTFTQCQRDSAYRAAGALSELIEPAADAVAVFEDGATFRVDAYYSTEAAADAALLQFTEIGVLPPGTPFKANVAPLPDENWVALSQAALPPVYAGRFIVCGSHDLDRVPRGRHTLIVEAGEAFGTAHHATTYGCLLALDRLSRQQAFSTVLDLGTGSGVLALALARVQPQAAIMATDIDARSIEVARENAARNNLGDRSRGPEFLVAEGVRNPRVQRAAPFDLIVANILAGPLGRMAPDIAKLLVDGATLVLSGILVHQAREVLARYRALGLDTIAHHRHNGWSTLVLSKRGRQHRVAGGSFNPYLLPDD